MAFKLLGKDMAIQITLGGDADGSVSYGSASSYLCVARSVRINRSCEAIDVSGLCDDEKEWRRGKKEGRLELEGVVFSDGFTFGPSLAAPQIGYYIKIETKEYSGLSAYRTWEGMITDWSWESGDGMQVERISVVLSADAA